MDQGGMTSIAEAIPMAKASARTCRDVGQYERAPPAVTGRLTIAISHSFTADRRQGSSQLEASITALGDDFGDEGKQLAHHRNPKCGGVNNGFKIQTERIDRAMALDAAVNLDRKDDAVGMCR